MKPRFCVYCDVWYDGAKMENKCPACLAESTARVVLWLDGACYLLSDIERADDGFIRRAWVVDGEWWLVLHNGEAQARGDHGSLLDKWRVSAYQELPVPDSMPDDYEKVLTWARRAG